MKRILGLDLGTNSIGWALIEQNFDKKEGRILGMGSRIIPMSQDVIRDFEKGASKSQTAERTTNRGARRLRQRHLLRRERLHRVLNIMGFLPKHYADQIDFEKRYGKYKDETEPKFAYNNKDFIFKDSFNEMLDDFQKHQPELVSNGCLVPYDWTIYFLRKKALKEPISKEEIAWIILNFNQKRGYYQLRGKDEENEETPNKLVEYHSLKVIDVLAEEKQSNKGNLRYSMHLENGWIYQRSSKIPLFDLKDKVIDFIVTTEVNVDGSVKKNKKGEEQRNFKIPDESDWRLVKEKSEKEIKDSGKTVGEFIYDHLLRDPKQKIRGKLIKTIERNLYREELEKILRKQIELQPELFSEELLNDCIRELYKNNEGHRQEINSRGFVHFFVNDIIFYQRPLKSQKSSIGRCSFEYRVYKVEDEFGNIVTKKEYINAIPKSHPLFQEYRLWQWILNLKILLKEDDRDVTNDFLNNREEYTDLFDFLNDKKEITQKILIEYLLKKTGLKKQVSKAEVEKYRWNYVQDKSYPTNTTRNQILSKLIKEGISNKSFLTQEKEIQLWHIIYSVLDKKEFEKALQTFAIKNNLNSELFVESFKNEIVRETGYGSLSEKAIKKLIPLMRIGKYWDWNSIDSATKNRISKIINGEYDINIKTRVYEKAVNLTKEGDFQGIPTWLANYIVYDRHSETKLTAKWETLNDLEKYIDEFRQHSLRNPIVEQVVLETLRVVRDIWLYYGKGVPNFFNEIHVELGREMKNSADERKKLTGIINENETNNLRIKAFLIELLNSGEIENVRPYSPKQQEALKIYEEGVLKSGINIPDDILKISMSATPSQSEFQRYKLWLDQKYRSPYTGQMISLKDLFTHAYQIEHIIPKARFFDDSFSNKVICESAVNELKDKMLGMEFIKTHQGENVAVGFGKYVKILSEDAYLDLIKNNFRNNPAKGKKLMLEDIPDAMIDRQLNDTRYISKFIFNLLSNIVREEENDDGFNSKNMIPGNGRITGILRKDWGLDSVWNDLILPRFLRLNFLTNTNDFTSYGEGHNKQIPTIPLQFAKRFNKKRIDHRHHAVDALVIACVTRDHINLINNQYAKSEKSRYDLQYKLRLKEKYIDSKLVERERFKEFVKPWNSFTNDAKNELERIVVSFKQNLRIISKNKNKYEKYVVDDNRLAKKFVKQIKGENWAIRKPLHTPMPYGKKTYYFDILKISDNLSKRNLIIDDFIRNNVEQIVESCNGVIKDSKNHINEKKVKDENGNEITHAAFKSINEKYRKRQSIYTLADRSTGGIEDLKQAIKFINKIADLEIRNSLLEHLQQYEMDIDKAFSSEGIDIFNSKRNIPVYKLPIAESGKGRFALGAKIDTRHKWVEAAKGTNLYFAIYESDEGKRSFNTIPLNKVIEQLKEGKVPVPEKNENGDKLLFHISPNDIVYIPLPDERDDINSIDFSNLTADQIKRFYVVNDFTSTTCYFTPNHIASNIIPKEVDLRKNLKDESQKPTGSFDLKTSTFEGELIKEVCIKVSVDRIGNVLGILK